MNKLAAMTLVLLFAAGIAYAKEYEISKKAGDYDVVVKIDRNPPVVGDNNVTIEIKGAGGHHVKDAKVVVDYSHAGHAGHAADELQGRCCAEGLCLRCHDEPVHGRPLGVTFPTKEEHHEINMQSKVCRYRISNAQRSLPV